MTEALAQTTISNAFPFLAAEQTHGDHQATEALLLTFNTDLGFFEARLLGLLRATGARVTVVGDARVWAPDTRAARHAGRSYHFGLCETAAAFHPKLTVLVGPKRAVATVGSGNLTMGGWQFNSELLTVFTGDTKGMPTAFSDIRSLLDSLADSSALDPIAAAAVRRTVSTLDGLLAQAPSIDTGHRVHASWDGPLINNLPSDQVAELHLSAAFHDPASAALHEVLHRLRPPQVSLAVQPGWTHLDPATVEATLSLYAQDSGATWNLLRDPTSEGEPEARYRHGKLIEWVTVTGERRALTGSPNLSKRALLMDVASGGNHEIAVIGPALQTLFPGGTPMAAANIPTLLGIDDKTGEAETAATNDTLVRVLVARIRDGEYVEVHLNRVAPMDVDVEVSLHSESPDQWQAIGNIKQGLSEQTFRASIPGGSRIRTVSIDPVTGLPTRTPPVYVTDEGRIRTRSIPSKHASRSHRAAAADLFGEDIALLESLQSDLAAFAQDLTNARQPAQAREPQTSDPSNDLDSRGSDRIEPWLWLQDDTVRRYGPGLASWLLALPHLQTSGSGAPEVTWLDKINEDTEVGLEDDDTEEVTQEVSETTPLAETAQPLDHAPDAANLKAARRKWAVRATAIAPEVPLLSRIFILRLTLAFWSAGNWPHGDIEPFTLVRDLIGSLDTHEDQPDELRERVGAITAVALTVMRQRFDVITQRTHASAYRDATELAKPLLSTLSEESIEPYVAALRTGHGQPLTANHVEQVVADLPQDDAFGWLTVQMHAHGYTVNRTGANHVHIRGSFSTPEQVAVDAMGIVEELDGVAIWASNEGGDWTLVVWNRPDLVTVNQRGGHTRWRHQHLTLMGPAASANSLKRGGPGNLPNVLPPRHEPTSAARAVLSSVGLAKPDPPVPNSLIP